MSYNYPNSISHDAYITLMNTGLPTNVGTVTFNELQYFSMTGPNMYATNSVSDILANPYDITSNTVLFMFTDTIEGYTNINMGSTTVDIAGVGIVVDNGLHLCPIAPDGTFMTSYMGTALGIIPAYTETSPTTSRIYACMTYQSQVDGYVPCIGGYVPCIGVGNEVDMVQYPQAYLNGHYNFTLGYFGNNIGNDLFEYALFGKYWDPYGTAPESGDDGGGSPYKVTDEPATYGDLPACGVTTTGMCGVYVCDTTQLQNFSAFLWSNSFIDTVIKNWMSPLENVVSLHILPINPNIIPTSASNIKIANCDSNVLSAKVTSGNDYISLDMGIINIAPYYLGFGDYETTITVYLPYIGFEDINISSCMDGYLTFTYRIDIVTGSFVAEVNAYTKRDNYAPHNIMQKNGNMAIKIPLSQSNYMSVYAGLVGAVTSFASNNVAGGIQSLMNTKPTYGSNGSLGGTTGLLGIKYPYVILYRPSYRQPKNMRSWEGITSNVFSKLSECTGYTKVQQGTFWGTEIPCTDAEREEIKTLLEGGIYI